MAHLARTSSAVTPAELHHSIPHAAWHTLACTPAALRAYRTHTLHRQCTSRRGQGRKLPREDSRLRACSPSSARSCASAAAKRSSADASASVRASMRARCTWASTLHQKSRREGHACRSSSLSLHALRCCCAWHVQQSYSVSAACIFEQIVQVEPTEKRISQAAHLHCMFHALVR
jgi:hypothetical protein